MLKRVVESSAESWSKWSNVYMVLSDYFCTSATPNPSASSEISLFRRVLQVSDARGSVLPMLDQWVREGRVVDNDQLRESIKQLRRRRRFAHALEVAEFMNRNMHSNAPPGNVAIQLDLISKVQGLEQAERYFDSFPATLRSLQLYGSLLNCYVSANSVEKAEDILQKMRGLGYSSTLSYNCMLSLYSRMSMHEKVEALLTEMEEKSITCNKYTFNILLHSYSATSKFDKMDKLIMKMEADPTIDLEWTAYAIAANGFLKANALNKALEMLKKCEGIIRVGERKIAHEFLLTTYASCGKKQDVYRVWNMHKKIGKFYSSSYLSMISSLGKLDDLDGAQMILEEWEAKVRSFDIRIPNLLVSAYCKKGLLEKAESVIKRLTDSGKVPNAGTWSRLALGYYKSNEMDKAVEAMKRAILTSTRHGKPNFLALASCLEYLKGKGEVEMAEELISLLKRAGLFTTGLGDRLEEFSSRAQKDLTV